MKVLGEGPHKKRVDRYRYTLQKVVLDVRDSGVLADIVLNDLVVCMAQDLDSRGVPGLYGESIPPGLVGHRIWECKGTPNCGGPAYK